MTNESLPKKASQKPDTNQILEDLKSYAAFERWMDEQLEILVARWIHRAAPNAQRAYRRSQFGR